MLRFIHRVICALTLLASPMAAQSLLDRLTFQMEIAADSYNLNLRGLPQDVNEAILTGTIDLRQQVMYDAPRRQISVRTFMISQGSPKPTSLLVVQNNEVEGFRADVTNILVDEATRTVTFDGNVAAGSNSAVHGAFEGAPFRLRARYSAGPLTRIDQANLSLPDGFSTTSFDGWGKLVVETTPNRPPVAEAGPPVVETLFTEILLDGLKSYDADGEELDYKWHVLAGSATLRGCETPTPILQLVQGQASYEVRLSVTDSRGATTYDYIRVIYSGR